MLPGWMAGHYTLDQCTIALEPLARAAKVELALSPAVSMNANERTVTLADGRVAEYDVLSIDTGSMFDRDAIQGAREHGLFLRPIEHFVQLYERLLALPTDRLLNLVVIGGGAAGFEVALALNHRFNGAGAERARVCLVTGDATVLPGFSPAVRERALRVLRRARVTVLNQRCIEISSGQVQLDNGARLVCDVPLLALPTVAPGWLQGSGLALDAHGFVSTDADAAERVARRGVCCRRCGVAQRSRAAAQRRVRGARRAGAGAEPAAPPGRRAAAAMATEGALAVPAVVRRAPRHRIVGPAQRAGPLGVGVEGLDRSALRRALRRAGARLLRRRCRSAPNAGATPRPDAALARSLARPEGDHHARRHAAVGVARQLAGAVDARAARRRPTPCCRCS